MRRIGGIAAVAAVMALGTASARAAEGTEQLAKTLQERSRALASLYDRLATEDGTQMLVKALASGKADDFAQVYAGLDLPVQNRCAWVQDAVDVVVSVPKPSEECVLRDDLTHQERLLYLIIAMRHAQVFYPAPPRATGPFVVVVPPPPIPSGPFRDELKANGLLKCALVFAQDGNQDLLFSPPYHFCLQEHP